MSGKTDQIKGRIKEAAGGMGEMDLKEKVKKKVERVENILK